MTEETQLAGRLRRLAATVVDAVLVPSLTLVLVMIAGVVEDAEDYTDNWWMLWVLLLAVLSYLILNGYLLWRRGQTLGKRLTGIAIVSAGRPDPAPLWKLICVRALFFPLLFLVVVPSLALIPIVDQLFIFGKRRRCLHDLVSGTEVVRLAGAGADQVARDSTTRTSA
jgi:uncharacterized RDD family membrane protein YckC